MKTAISSVTSPGFPLAVACRLCYYAVFLLLAALPVQADGVAFKSGQEYQIRCLLWPVGAVGPAHSNVQALLYHMEATDDCWWKITEQEDGTYVIRHTESGRFFTWDGQRTSDRRYMSLSTTSQGIPSKWCFHVGQTGMGLQSAHRTDHYLNVRYQTGIVGTYRSLADSFTENERFFLVNRKGKVVTRFKDRQINLPDACFGNGDKAVKPGKPVADVPQPAAKVPAPSSRKAPSVQSQAALLPLTIDGRKPVYDERSRLYFYSIPDRKDGKDFIGKVNIAGKRQSSGLYINGIAAASSGRCRFSNPENGRVFRITQVEGGDTVAYADITFTFLPIVELGASSITRNSFTPGSFRLSDPDCQDTDSVLAVKLRHRGEYATLFTKKSFALKFVDAAGRKQNRCWLGMRKDNYWILDAMAVDHARMRNRVGMDLWLDMNPRPYYNNTALNGVRGRLVEVFLNGKYHGVYHLSERIDRKQLQLAKTQEDKVRGCLYKTQQWDNWTLMGINRHTGRPSGQKPPFFDNRSASWGLWEGKYPEPGRKKQTDWQPLYDAIAFCSTADDRTFARDASRYFDLPVLRDYYLFIELLHAMDNSGKNMYWAVHDKDRSCRLTPIPWDLDATFGRSWNGHRSGCEASNHYTETLRRHSQQNALFTRLYGKNPGNDRNNLAIRYRELRQTYFRPDRIYARFAAYHGLLERSGAAAREAKRWNGPNNARLDFAAEMAYIRQWLTERVAVLDQQYGR